MYCFVASIIPRRPAVYSFSTWGIGEELKLFGHGPKSDCPSAGLPNEFGLYLLRVIAETARARWDVSIARHIEFEHHVLGLVWLLELENWAASPTNAQGARLAGPTLGNVGS